jgi:hypothetical protein
LPPSPPPSTITRIVRAHNHYAFYRSSDDYN